jgi:trehalose synthase
VRIDFTADLWWKNAVFYCLDVETFMDGDGDGCGDFTGLIQQVDYLAGLGVTCIWLMPFYPTPNRDDGYDITDYLAVDPRLGTLGDFVEFIRTAHDRGLRVIIDLVVNHTSDEHPWFQAARSSPDSNYRDYYVWRKDKPAEPPDSVAFPGEETSIWQRDRRAGAYYLHRFYRYQPDLNIANARVRDEIAKVMGFWLHQGVSGFRVDAVPALAQVENRSEAPDFDPQACLRELRSFMARRAADAMWLGEANVEPDEESRYLGGDEGDELNMLFDFVVMQAIYLSLARGSAEPLEEALRRLPKIPKDTQWANFLRNHDELTLDKLTVSQRAEVLAAFGPEAEMQLYGHGLRPGSRLCSTATSGDYGCSSPRLQPARHASAVLRRRDRDGRQPVAAGPACRAHADAVDGRLRRRLLGCAGIEVGAAARGGPVRTRGRQRRGSATRP